MSDFKDIKDLEDFKKDLLASANHDLDLMTNISYLHDFDDEARNIRNRVYAAYKEMAERKIYHIREINGYLKRLKKVGN